MDVLVCRSAPAAVAILRGLAVAPGELPVWGALLVLTGIAKALLIRACRMEDPRAQRLAHGLTGPNRIESAANPDTEGPHR